MSFLRIMVGSAFPMFTEQVSARSPAGCPISLMGRLLVVRKAHATMGTVPARVHCDPTGADPIHCILPRAVDPCPQPIQQAAYGGGAQTNRDRGQGIRRESGRARGGEGSRGGRFGKLWRGISAGRRAAHYERDREADTREWSSRCTRMIAMNHGQWVAGCQIAGTRSWTMYVCMHIMPNFPSAAPALRLCA